MQNCLDAYADNDMSPDQPAHIRRLIWNFAVGFGLITVAYGKIINGEQRLRWDCAAELNLRRLQVDSKTHSLDAACVNFIMNGGSLNIDWLQSFLQFFFFFFFCCCCCFLSFFITSCSCIYLFNPIYLFYYRNSTFSTKGHNLSNHYKLY